jgi:hypothetical protein
MNPSGNPERDWQKLAQRTALKVNAAWVMQSAGTGLIFLGIVGFPSILICRSFASEPSLASLAGACLGGLLLIFIAAWFIVGKHRIPPNEALVRLEFELGLNNALTAAQQGKASWPYAPPKVKDGLRWQWQRMLIPPLFFIACILGARVLPLNSVEPHIVPTGKPQAWTQMQEWLQKLKEEKVADKAALEEREQKLQALSERPKEEWFSHESLNASDELREQLKRDIQRLGQQLSDAARSLDALNQHQEKLSEAGREQMQKELTEAVEQMRSGTMKPDAELMNKLSQLDPKELKGLSQEQLKQMQESMKQKAGVCESMKQGFGSDKGFLGDGEGQDDALAERKQSGNQMPTGPNQNDAGQGEANRGPGTAPLTLSEEENDFGTNKTEALTSRDFRHAQPGTLLGMQNGKHEIDPIPSGPQAAGTAKSLGQGGGQVWRDSLTPEEKAVLKQVFR